MANEQGTSRALPAESVGPGSPSPAVTHSVARSAQSPGWKTSERGECRPLTGEWVS